MSEWNTHLAKKGWMVSKKQGGFMIGESIEPIEVELKKFRIVTHETLYTYFEVEAENEEEAKDMVKNGEVDSVDTDYINWYIDDVEEI